MKRLIERINEHFEWGFLAYVWFNSAVLAALVGRPMLGAIGTFTVLPFLIAYIVRARATRSTGGPPDGRGGQP